MSRWQAVLRIQIPQMFVLIVPALVNLIIVLSKETAVLSIVTVPELTFVLTGIGSATFAFVETLLALCVCYLLLVDGKQSVSTVTTGLVGASTTEVLTGVKAGDVVVEPTVSVTASTGTSNSGGFGGGGFGGGGFTGGGGFARGGP